MGEMRGAPVSDDILGCRSSDTEDTVGSEVERDLLLASGTDVDETRSTGIGTE
jgi:hypothetical protein